MHISFFHVAYYVSIAFITAIHLYCSSTISLNPMLNMFLQDFLSATYQLNKEYAYPNTAAFLRDTSKPSSGKHAVADFSKATKRIKVQLQPEQPAYAIQHDGDG